MWPTRDPPLKGPLGLEGACGEAWKSVHTIVMADIQTKKRKIDVLEMDAMVNKSLKLIKTLRTRRTNEFRESQTKLMDCCVA